VTEPIRLARRVALQTGCSRREAELLIEGAWVRVDGQLVEEPQARVADTQAVTLDPGARPLPIPAATFLLSQPADTSQPQALLTPERRAPDDGSGIRLVARHRAHQIPLLPLPALGAGLAVWSQDPAVQRRLQEDADTLEQEVMVSVDGAVTPEQLARLCHGLSFNGRPLPPIKVSVGSSSAQATRLRFALKGIRPGQVPSMCADVGLHMTGLLRQRIGRIGLGGLAPGQWRLLRPGERF
jgi:23S rRNA pseudouridine2604 synthase